MENLYIRSLANCTPELATMCVTSGKITNLQIFVVVEAFFWRLFSKVRYLPISGAFLDGTSGRIHPPLEMGLALHQYFE